MGNLCNQNVNVLQHQGNRISKEQAITDLKEYTDTLGSPETAVIGHYFGLETFKEFIQEMERHNENNSDPAKLITGFRVYRSRKPNRVTDDKADVFVMPVLSTGEDLYKVFDFDALEDDLILADSLPCPNFCSGDGGGGFTFRD